jgi:hypothetical protein
MPEYKGGQKYFTISFDPITDSVRPETPYMQSWTELVLDYRQRITEFPVLQKEVADKLTLSSIPSDDKIYFQKFIDRINTLFDHDFISIKELLLPDVWKLGVGLYPGDKNFTSYQIYKIPYSEPSPLICSLEGNPFDLDESSPLAFSSHSVKRTYIGDPERAAEKYVLDYVKKAVRNRSLAVHGKLLSTDILFAFLDQHSHSIGLKPNQEIYSVHDINYGLKIYLPNICARVAQDLRPVPPTDHVVIDFDMVSQMIQQGTVPPQLRKGETNSYFFLYSLLTPLKPIFDSVRFLIANDITQIERPFSKPIRPVGPASRWIWSGYTEESERQNIFKILNSSLAEYSAFVCGNRFKFLNSPYLDSTTAVVYVYERSKEPNSPSWPVLDEYFIENVAGRLPKLTIAIGYCTSPRVEHERFPVISVEGQKYSASSHSTTVASFLFHRTPVMNLVYSMLRGDLERHYEIGHIG